MFVVEPPEAPEYPLRQLIRANIPGCVAATLIGLSFPFWGKYAAAALYIGWLLAGGQ